ncbi:sensor histidine kinase [Ornithinimicrobium panacihumi]|uniref:sensor histidine kinase n=1 Tax=Ornithinimicrobium panacihumi TaxID=2008449 RepID=UPI003F8BC897
MSSHSDTLALLHAAQELSTIDDVGELLRRSLRIVRAMTGAGVTLFGVDDEAHPGWFSHVLSEGIDRSDDTAETLMAGHEDPRFGVRVQMPVVVGGTEFGTLLATGWEREPDARDRLMVEAIATALGPRLESVRQRRVGALHQQVAETVWELDRTLVDAVDLEVTLPLLAARVRELSGARSVALVAPGPQGSQRLLAGAGREVSATLTELEADVHEALAGRQEQHWTTAPPDPQEQNPRPRCTSLVPLDTRDRSSVVMVVSEWRPFPGVTQQQVRDALSVLALHASLILDREEGEREHDLLTLLEDRDRIARDLHDLVIQRLFAVGLTLQGASRRATVPEVKERLEGAVSELDQTIRDIRATIFELRHRPDAGSFRADLRQLVESYAPTLGFAPLIELVGPLDSVADDEAQSQVLMVVREALSNVARHARASSVVVQAVADADNLRISVRDDGVGIPAETAHSGLGNVRARAHERGGDVELLRVEPHGTELRWWIPV